MPSTFQLTRYSHDKSETAAMVAAVNETLRGIASRPISDQRKGMLRFLWEAHRWALAHPTPGGEYASADLDPAKLDIFGLARHAPFQLETRRSIIRLSPAGSSVELDPASVPKTYAVFGGASPLRCDDDLYARAAALVKIGYYDLPVRFSRRRGGRHKGPANSKKRAYRKIAGRRKMRPVNERNATLAAARPGRESKNYAQGR